jgi:hypothetical protein
MFDAYIVCVSLLSILVYTGAFSDDNQHFQYIQLIIKCLMPNVHYIRYALS